MLNIFSHLTRGHMNRREETESVYVFIFIVSFVHDKCRFSLYFILTARNAILSDVTYSLRLGG